MSDTSEQDQTDQTDQHHPGPAIHGGDTGGAASRIISTDPAEPAGPEAPPAEVTLDHTRLAVAFPGTYFDSGVEGAPVVTSAGTDVPNNVVQEVKDAAERTLGVDLVEVTG